MNEVVYKVVIGSYSLAVGQIGKPTGRPPLVREFGTPEAAMRDLDRAINEGEGRLPYDPTRPSEGQTYCIEMPDGRKLPLDTVYREVFGVPPVYRDNEANEYPLLVKRGKKRVRR